MNILVTGSNGQLGSEIKDLSNNYKDFNFFFKDIPELDISKKADLESFFIENKINAVINCAAYTSVDKAEEDECEAEKVNSEGVLNIVNALEKVSGKLIHISTDYVFDGNGHSPYKESDSVNPVGIYAKTKRNGEIEVIKSNIDGIIIRTSWLYSSYGNNFLKKMLDFGRKKKRLSVVSDQIGSPTYALELAKICLDILLFKGQNQISEFGNIYHFSNDGEASWFDFATEIMKLSKISCQVDAVETKEYPTLAKRPKYSVLDKKKIKKDFGFKISHWKDSLAKCIKKINNN